jgi:hypothetical protein
MVIYMLLIETMAAENVDVIASAEDPAFGIYVRRKQVSQPKNIIFGCPCTLSTAVDSVEGNNT